MEIKNLITFTKVAEEQSLSRAARLLGYAQSTVTMQMQQLEQELGVPLYERVGKQIRITQAGQELLSYAVPIIRMSQEALKIGRGASGMAAGTLRLGVLEALVGGQLARQADDYLEVNPQVKLDIQVSTDSKALLNLLRHNRIDLLLTLDYPITDSDLAHAVEAVPEQVRFYAAEGHPLCRRSALLLEEILAYPLIRGAKCLPYEQELDRLVGQRQARQVFVENQDLAVRMAMKQDGRETLPAVLLLPDCAAQGDQKDGGLTALDYEFPGCHMQRQVIYHKNKWLTGAMSAWIAMTAGWR